VTTVATILRNRRPSVLAAACAPSVLGHAVRGSVLGQPVVQIRVRTAPVFGYPMAEASATKINYNGTFAAAAAERAATPVLPSSAKWAQKVQGDMVKGGDARGIPPRGTPV
jgi:hypothetical protein